MTIREDAKIIINEAITAVRPDAAVKAALRGYKFSSGKIYLVAGGKAAWQMAKTAVDALQEIGRQIERGVVVTKYGHSQGGIENCEVCEAAHPVPDENSFAATEKAIALVENLQPDDTVLFLLSGGASALFEKPLVSGEELAGITGQLLASGADIVEMNTVRKRLSAVKGGKFANLCAPAKVYTIVLSDILGDPLDMIGSGPTYPDSSNSEDALNIVEKYNLKLSDKAIACLKIETPKELPNIETSITGSVRNLCRAAANSAANLGYKPMILTDSLDCVARDGGAFLAAIAKTWQDAQESAAFIVGGECVVKITGSGKGGRNQEFALAAAPLLDGLKDTLIFSVGSDGTDGPTDAAGGIVDNTSQAALNKKGIDVFKVLQDNDSYNALKAIGGLVITGPTGTNVNDVAVLLIKR